MKIFYGRTSTREQDLTRQLDWAKEKGINEENIYTDQLTGKSFNRPNYKSMVEVIKAITNNTDEKIELYIMEIDRLGRNKELSLKELRMFKKLGVTMRIGNIPTTMTDNKNSVMDEMVQNIMIEIYTTMAQEEIRIKEERQRTAYDSYGKDKDGKQLGRKGQVVGRKSLQKTLSKQQDLYIKAWLDKDNKEYKLKDCIKDTELSRATLYRIKKIRENK